MTKKKEPVMEDDPNQSEAFRKAVRDLEAAGELKGESGDKAIDALLKQGAVRSRQDEKQ